jgi:NAD(P)-dependent dehydrogenase (short-subunit alcohol dehydrogenase family)
MARAGARVVVTDLPTVSLDETVALVKEAGAEVMALPVDVTDMGLVRAAVAKTVERFGRLDCAHNNAGIATPPALTHETSFENLQRTMNVNVYGVFHCMQAEIEVMLKQGGGTIVNTASVAGLVASVGNAAYSASKAAVISLTKTAGVEYASQGIRINAVCPGVTQTAMTASMQAEERNAFLGATPIGRIGSPTEIADVVVWLSSPQSSFVVGATICVDGGYSVP